ncbi:uncharacterized protein LOC123699326 [Colias croceus]|uniref:uncharacterized protein LOC123699326 n=1 Tax=Colias crocea TaxID=72248 RepID=UPI001E27C524|nr:uncharacterized protein LOC123699326 [Colias croceus]
MAQLEQSSRDNNLEIQCVPEQRNENLLNIINKIASTVKYDLKDTYIAGFHRVAKLDSESKRPRNIILKMNNQRTRDDFLAAIKTFNRQNGEKLNTSLIGLAGAKSPIFISEHLSPANKQLHAATRLAAKEKKYDFIWIRNARIFIHEIDRQLLLVSINEMEVVS